MEDRGTIHSNTVAAAAAATVGAAGSVSVYDFSGDGTGAYESYLKGNGKNVVTDAKEKTGASSAQMRNKETSVTAEVGKGTTIQSGSLTIDSKDSLTMNTKAGAGAASANTAVGATVSVVNANTKTAARIGDNAKITTTAGDVGVHADTEHRFGGNIAGASASYYAAGAVVVSKTTDKAATEAAIGSGTTIQSEKDILIDAERTHDNSVTAVGASAAVYGAAAAVELEDEIEGKTEAHLGKEENEIASDIKGGNIKGDNIKIDADTKVKTDLTAVAPTAAGVAGGAGTGVKAIDKTTTRAYIGKKERISEANSVAVHAAAAPELNVTGTAAGIGVAAGVGAVTALASSNETVTAEILDGAKLGSKEKTIGSLDVSARTNVPKDGSTLHVAATGASGGIAGATAVFAEANMNDTTKAIVGKSVEVYAGKDKGTIQVEAVHEEQNVVDIQSIGVAGAGGTGAKSTNTSQSTAAVEIAKGSTKENDASVLYNQQNQVRILAENGTSSGGNQSNTQVVGVSAVGASGLTAKSQKNYAASVDIGANTLIHGSSDPGILQKYADKNAVVIQAVNHVKASDTLQHEIVSGASGAGLVNTNTTKADAAVHVGGSARIESGLTDRLSSTVKADSENQALRKTDKIEETKGYESDTVGGGNIVIAAYNDANIKSQADMSAWALISGAGIKNKVEYTGTQTVDIGKNAAVETAEGSISLLAGRKASGEAQQVRVHGAGILNNHALAPISAGSGPVVSGTSESKINLGEGSGIYSDQDVNIRSNEDNLQVTHNGQLKDWTREMIDMFGGDVVNIGSSKETQSGTIVADGKVATGIHRKQEIEIGGTYDEKTGTWNTLVERDGSVGFDVELGKTASSLLFERMNELETLIADYAGDPAAKKAYEMELEEIQDKLVDQGLGVYGEGNKFYALAQGELSEFDEAHNFLLLNEGKRDDLVKQKEGLTLAKEKVDALKKAYTDWNTETDAVKKDEAFHKMETVLAEYNSSVSQEDTFQIGNMEEAKIIDAKIQRADLAISTRIDAASDSIDSIDKAKQLYADSLAFYEGGGTYKNDKFYDASGNVLDNDRAEQLLGKEEKAVSTVGEVRLHDITATRGNIMLEGGVISGKGSLDAGKDAEVRVTNASPNQLTLGNITVTDGGSIYRNGKLIKDTKALQAGNRNKEAAPTIADDSAKGPAVEIENRFNNREYTATETIGGKPVERAVFGASTITLNRGKTISNKDGLVSITSNKGDITVNGDIKGGSIDIKAKSGDYTQSYTPGIQNIGGDPKAIYQGQGESHGVTANGSIMISARYLNINGKIQSGIADWNLEIPEDTGSITVTDGQMKKKISELTEADISSGKKWRLTEGGNAAEYVTYDAKNQKFEIDGIEVNGGKIQLYGTILNTSKDGAKLSVLDGYGTINVANYSALPIELKNISTGSGVEGKIIIQDIQADGETIKTTEYRRLNGQIQKSENGGEWTDAGGVYNPTKGLTYTWTTGQDKEIRTDYRSSRTNFDIGGSWGKISSKDPSAVKINETTGIVYDKADGTYVSYGNPNQFDKSEDVIHESLDVTTEDRIENWDHNAKRKYLVTKEHTYTWTEVKKQSHYDRYTAKADYGIGIDFIGNESAGQLHIESKSDVGIAGTVENKKGDTTISGANIYQTNDRGVIRAENLTLSAGKDGQAGMIGQAGQELHTETSNLAVGQVDSLYIENSGGQDLNIKGRIDAKGLLHLENQGSILGTKQATQLKGSSIELISKEGSLGRAGKELDVETGTGSGDTLTAEAQNEVYISAAKAKTNKNLRIEEVSGSTVVLEADQITGNDSDRSLDAGRAERLKQQLLYGALEESPEAAAKQKAGLKEAVQEKYDRYQALASQVDETGQYRLSEEEMTAAGTEETAREAYRRERQQAFEQLQAEGVGSWTAEEVAAYDGSFTLNQEENGLYRFADNRFLTEAEQERVLRGGTVSAQDIAAYAVSDQIKKSAALSAYQHGQADITGDSVTLKGNVGRDESVYVIDLKDKTSYNDFTTQELVALASAEAGEITRNGDQIEIRRTNALDVDAANQLSIQSKDHAYVSSQNDVKLGNIDSRIVKIQGSGSIRTAGEGKITADRLIAEAAGGSVDVKAESRDAEGIIVTGRAKDNVAIQSKSGVQVESIYAEEGQAAIQADGRIRDWYGRDGRTAIQAQDVHLDGAEIGAADSFLGVKAGTEMSSSYTAKGDLYLRQQGDGSSIDVLQSETGSAYVKTQGGRLRASSVSAAKDVTLEAVQEDGVLTVETDSLRAGGRAQLKGADITLQHSDGKEATKVSANELIVHADNRVDLGNINGTVGMTDIQAQTVAAGDVNTRGNIGIRGQQVTTGDMKGASISLLANRLETQNIVGTGEVSLAAADEARIGTVSGEAVLVIAETVNAGDIAASGNASVRAGGQASLGSVSGNDVTLEAETVNAGDIAASGNAAVRAGGQASLGRVSGNDVTVEAGTLEASGITANGNAAVQAGGQASLGSVSGNDVTVEAETLNAEDIAASGNASVRAGDQASLGSVSGNDVTVEAGTVNAGDIAASGNAAVRAGGQASLGSVSGNDVTVEAVTVNASDIEASGNAAVRAGGQATLGRVSGNDVTVEAETLEASDITANGNASIRAGGQASLGSVSGNDVTVEAGTVNAEDIAASGNAAVRAGGQASLGSVSGNDVTVEAGTVNAGEIAASGNASVRAAETAAVGTLAADAAAVQAKTVQAVLILGEQKADIQAGSVQAGIVAGGQTRIQADSVEAGVILADKDADITAKENLQAQAVLGENTHIQAGRVESGIIGADNQVSIASDNQVQAGLIAGADTNIQAKAVQAKAVIGASDLTIRAKEQVDAAYVGGGRTTIEAESLRSKVLAASDSLQTRTTGETDVETISGQDVSIAADHLRNQILEAAGTADLQTAYTELGRAEAAELSIQANTVSADHVSAQRKAAIEASGNVEIQSAEAGDISIQANALTADTLTAAHSLFTDTKDNTNVRNVTANSVDMTGERVRVQNVTAEHVWIASRADIREAGGAALNQMNAVSLQQKDVYAAEQQEQAKLLAMQNKSADTIAIDDKEEIGEEPNEDFTIYVEDGAEPVDWYAKVSQLLEQRKQRQTADEDMKKE